MNLEISLGIFGQQRPPVTKPIPEFLLEVGEQGIRDLVSKHYDSIKTSTIRDIFPADDAVFEEAKTHSSDFFIHICGGPAHFNKNRGAPQMVARHGPFRIDAAARITWLGLYKPLILELKENGVTEKSLNSLWGYLNVFSIWMINTPN